jgi:pentatricopeptide repeat protein
VLKLLKKTLFFMGLICCLQFFIAGMIGVIRGYSIQSYAPSYICMLGVLLLVSFNSKNYKVSCFCSFVLLFSSAISIAQGHHLEKGNLLYKQKEFLDAIVEFEKECHAWYLKLKYNYNEGRSLSGIAKCYSQLGEFEKASLVYRKMIKQFEGYNKNSAKESLADLENGLKEIKAFDKVLASKMEDDKKCDLLFDLALVYRRMYCYEKSVECYHLIQDLNVRKSRKQQAMRFASKDYSLYN